MLLEVVILSPATQAIGVIVGVLALGAMALGGSHA